MRDMELYLVLVVDPYDEPSYGDLLCVRPGSSERHRRTIA